MKYILAAAASLGLAMFMLGGVYAYVLAWLVVIVIAWGYLGA